MLGYQRPKCDNYLLLKDDVGKGKPTTRDLPPDGFTFGKTEVRDLEGVGKGRPPQKFQNSRQQLEVPRSEQELEARQRFPQAQSNGRQAGRANRQGSLLISHSRLGSGHFPKGRRRQTPRAAISPQRAHQPA